MPAIRRERMHMVKRLQTNLQPLITTCMNWLYPLGKKISRGAYNQVYACKYDPTLVIRTPLNRVSKEDCEDEWKAQCIVDELPAHPNLLRQPRSANFLRIMGRLPRYAMVLTRMDETLDTALKQMPKGAQLSKSDVGHIMREVVSGLMHLHFHNYLHLDIKPENIMIHWNGARRYQWNDPRVSIRLIDYGFLALIGTLDVGRGTPGYIAPEQNSGECIYKPSADIYSIGVTIAQLVLNPATNARSFEQWCKTISKGPLTLRNALQSKGWSEEEAKVILQCWLKTPNSRPKLDTVYTILT